jgi:coniferyl-aldehyde dehydrogenase
VSVRLRYRPSCYNATPPSRINSTGNARAGRVRLAHARRAWLTRVPYDVSSMSIPQAAAPVADPKLLLDAQRSAFLAEGFVSDRVRRDRLTRAIDLLVSHETQICAALAADFGQRPASLTRFMDIFPAVHALKFARKNLERWMRPLPRTLGFPNVAPGSSAEIVYQPLGVVGVISPWNFPVTLTFGPLAGILAAGNRCMIKPSELTPKTSDLLRKLIGMFFDSLEVTVVTGGPEVAESFARLPFDHLLFTGSTQVGRRVMAAAAEHLVPVTLELGGKCPVIIGRSANLTRAVDRVLLGKLANAGQICLAPDYVCVPRESVDTFVDEARKWTRRAYPEIFANPDYTSLISAHHLRRTEELLADARAHGAQIIELSESNPPRSPQSDTKVMAPALILHATDQMRVMREEIFAPLLPVLPYDELDTVIADVQRGERPLALYYFGTDKSEERRILERTMSGGVTVNDIAMHFLAEELPFGGVGASGLGAYHGVHGFRRFSHARAVFRQSRLDIAGLIGLRPPYGARLRRCLGWFIRR